MLIEEELAHISPEKDTALTIGVFDGIHLGHKSLISLVKEEARRRGLLSGVVTFRDHPREVLGLQPQVPHLTTFAEKEKLLKDEGVDFIVSLSFTKELADMSAHEFVTYLRKYLRMRSLIIGPDFTLGKGKEGNADTLRALGEEMGFTVTVATPLKLNKDTVSSTAIRNALAAGEIEKANRMLGRPYSLKGRVTRGEARGATLGFPTANIEVSAKKILPADGVYATWAYVEGKPLHAMTNIGWRPTFGSKERTIETFIPQYCGNLYGRELKIEIVARLRGEKRFDSIEDLKKQMLEDVRYGTEVLNSQDKRLK